MKLVLEVDALRVRRAASEVLKGIDSSIGEGEFVVLIGPNGCGKTTLLRAIAGILPLSAGCIRVAGFDVGKSPVQAKSNLGLGVDPAALPDLLTGNECLRLFASARGLNAVPATCLALAQDLDVARMLDRRIAAYSLGMRQKLGILLGLMGEPPLLLLDEPFNGLDPRSAITLKRHLRARVEQGCSVLIATHALDIAEQHAGQAWLMIDGRLCKRWDRAALAALRDNPHGSLEHAMADALAP